MPSLPCWVTAPAVREINCPPKALSWATASSTPLVVDGDHKVIAGLQAKVSDRDGNTEQTQSWSWTWGRKRNLPEGFPGKNEAEPQKRTVFVLFCFFFFTYSHFTGLRCLDLVLRMNELLCCSDGSFAIF